jgi:hypothetical protein
MAPVTLAGRIIGAVAIEGRVVAGNRRRTAFRVGIHAMK